MGKIRFNQAPEEEIKEDAFIERLFYIGDQGSNPCGNTNFNT